jgi:hypothetical protein
MAVFAIQIGLLVWSHLGAMAFMTEQTMRTTCGP